MKMERVDGADRADAGRGTSPKLIVAGVLAVLAVVFIAQNTDSKSVNLLWADITAPQWLWLVIMVLIGVVIGSLFPWFRRRSS